MKPNNRLSIRLEVGPDRQWRFVVREEALTPQEEEGARSRFLRWLAHRYRSIRRDMSSTNRGWLKALDATLGRLESRIDPIETLLMQSRKAGSIFLSHPQGIRSPLVERRFRRAVRRGLRRSSRGILLNLLLLPFTAAMTLLPGPNVFFGWNAYRLISHYLAREGGRRIVGGDCVIGAAPEDLVRVDDKPVTSSPSSSSSS